MIVVIISEPINDCTIIHNMFVFVARMRMCILIAGEVQKELTVKDIYYKKNSQPIN